MAYGAYLGRFLADVQVSAVAANPYGVAFAREYDALLDVLKQTTIALLVVLLHVGPLIVLAFGGGTEIVHRV